MFHVESGSGSMQTPTESILNPLVQSNSRQSSISSQSVEAMERDICSQVSRVGRMQVEPHSMNARKSNDSQEAYIYSRKPMKLPQKNSGLQPSGLNMLKEGVAGSGGPNKKFSRSSSQVSFMSTPDKCTVSL